MTNAQRRLLDRLLRSPIDLSGAPTSETREENRPWRVNGMAKCVLLERGWARHDGWLLIITDTGRIAFAERERS